MSNKNRNAPGTNDQLMAPPPSREVITYDIPPGLAPFAVTESFGPIASIGIVLLSPLEEKKAASRTKGDAMQLAYELGQASLYEVNGRLRVQDSDGSRDKLWGELHPKLRNLVMQAYAAEAVADDASSEAFLGSRKVRA